MQLSSIFQVIITTMKHVYFMVFLATASCFIEVYESYPHRIDCYTQGMFFINSTHVFESCGLYNRSFFRIMEYTANPFELREIYATMIPFEPSVFLEGSVLFKGYIYILTWRQNIVYKIDPKNFQIIEKHHWNRQGWGLTHNNTHMFATDGSDRIYVVNEEFKILESRAIRFNDGRKAYNLNQLEYVGGYIYANIYYQHQLYKISYEEGKILQSYDGKALLNEEVRANPSLKSDEVMNGIAYNKENNLFLVTGKNWKHIFQIEL